MNTITQNPTKQKKDFRPIDLAYIAMAVALMAVCSWIAIPTAIPFTLQTFAVFLSCLLLGGWRGTVSVLVYILLGAVGAPVFSGFSGGIARLLGPTGGYILGFLFTALLMWAMEYFFGTGIAIRIISMIAGLFVCYLFGTLWFCHVYVGEDGSHIGIVAALLSCVVPYLLPDAAKIALALIISSNKALRRTVRSDLTPSR